MSEDPMKIIEAYLGHVREHLPEGKADEIIAELRGYMIEMTEALSDEAVTIASAKRVVARFGAPSELAQEYVLPSSDSTEIDMEASQQEVAEDMLEQRRELSPAGYVVTFLKFITITVLWIVSSWTIITPFAYWWASSPTIFAPIFQFGMVTVVFAGLLLRSKDRRIQLRNMMFRDWSSRQKLVTFPENLAVEMYGGKVLVDIGLTILTTFFFVFSILSPFAFVSLAVPFLIAHLVYAIRRFGNSDPASFIRREFAANVGLLVVLNAVITWGFYPWAMSSYRVSAILVYISAGYSILILYQIVIRLQDLWWEAAGFEGDQSEKSPGLSPDVKRKLLNRTKRTALRSIGGIGATFSAIIVTGLLFPFLTGTGMDWYIWNTRVIYIVVMTLSFALVSVGLAALYFGVRYYLVRSRGRTSVFGKRTRGEAAIDLFVTGVVFTIVMSSLSYWAGRMVSDVLGLSSGANPLVRLVLSTAIIVWVPFLFIAIVARIAADFGDLRESGSVFAREAMALSGNLFLIEAALMTGVYFLLLSYLEDPYLHILSEMFGILMISYAVLVLFAFQKSTSRTKLKWRRETDSPNQNRQ